MAVQRAAILGVGLIGGSLAGAWRKEGFATSITGIEADEASAAKALELGLVDAIEPEVPGDAELIAICTPSDQVVRHVIGLKDHPGVLLDVGSVKHPIVEELYAQLGSLPERFVPSHPIAGAETSGPAAARDNLFAGATTVITPADNADESAVHLVEQAWQAAGTKVQRMSSGEHDAMLAVTSHLPHALAFAFLQQVEEGQLDFTGGGFRDFTRIAAANPELWWRIFRMNQDALLDAGETFSKNLGSLVDALRNNDEAAGIELLRRARDMRNKLEGHREGGQEVPGD